MKAKAIHKSARVSKNQIRLGLFGLILILIQLTGCASAPRDETKYNPDTGYPVVGTDSW